MSETYRLIVAGSREYDDRLSLRTTLNGILEQLNPAWTLIVVHGGEKYPEDSFAMSDRIAGEWALEAKEQGLPVEQEPHPAKWEDPCRETCSPGHRRVWSGRDMCPAAGPYRNQEMVRAGADQGLLALRVGTKSTGSRNTALLMLEAGIPFTIIVQGDALGLPRDLIGAAGSGPPEED